MIPRSTTTHPNRSIKIRSPKSDIKVGTYYKKAMVSFQAYVAFSLKKQKT